MFIDLVPYLWIIWLSLVILFVIIELLTLDFTFLMIAAGTLVGGLGGYLLRLDWWAQVLAAAVLSVLFLFLIRPALLARLHRGADVVSSNIDAIPGLGARVMRDFDEGQGVVKLDNGETWTARLSPDTRGAALHEGDRTRVVRVDGAIVEVAPVTDSPAPDGGPTERTLDA